MSCMHMGVSKNNGTPQISNFYRVFHYKPSILGFPYFWKHPQTATCFYFPLNRFFLRPGVWRTCCRNSEFWRRFVAETIWRKKQVSQALWRMKQWTNEGFTASIFAKSSYLVIYAWILWGNCCTLYGVISWVWRNSHEGFQLGRRWISRSSPGPRSDRSCWFLSQIL